MNHSAVLNGISAKNLIYSYWLLAADKWQTDPSNDLTPQTVVK